MSFRKLMQNIVDGFLDAIIAEQVAPAYAEVIKQTQEQIYEQLNYCSKYAPSYHDLEIVITDFHRTRRQKALVPPDNKKAVEMIKRYKRAYQQPVLNKRLQTMRVRTHMVK